eukprot:3351146-Prymnesium_polylepis.1
MQLNRVGLPRRYLQQLKRKLKCANNCKHAGDLNRTCKKWAWTNLHKGEWELHIWTDKILSSGSEAPPLRVSASPGGLCEVFFTRRTDARTRELLS